MQIKLDKKSDTEWSISAAANEQDLQPIRRQVFNKLRPQVKAAGFRPGRAPDHIVEKELGPQRTQAEFIELAASQFYSQAAKEHGIRAVGPPQVDLKKFVPYSQLELVYNVEVFPQVKLADYKKIKKTVNKVNVSDKEIQQVIEGLRIRAGKRSLVKRPAKKGDEVILDMSGRRDGVEVPGSKATNYAVLIGSGRFVPGFENSVIGLKAGDSKNFDVIFPKDYPEPTLQEKKVHFKTKIHKVQAVKLPTVDDKFAKSVGPFKNLSELKMDIKKQLLIEKEDARRRRLTDEVVTEIVTKSKLSLPQRLLERQLEHMQAEFERNVKAQGKTVDDYLREQTKTRQEIEQMMKPEAQRRVKTALVLSEIANQEGIKVSPEELEIRLQILKGRYKDKAMQAQLDKPEVRRDIANQLLTEKTLAKIVEYATR
ncbi:trigger factor [Candidatus Microgenomates bacterium]|nr:trigger factor [Candidatus Microgenomates bacterium]